jgi:hypothetical protein
MKLIKLFCALTLMLVVSAVYAEPAAVFHEGSCGIPTPSGGVLSTQYHKTATYSESGVAVLKCRVAIEDYTDGQYHDTGFDCGIDVPGVGLFNTTDSMVNISESGQATLTCKVMTNVTP